MYDSPRYPVDPAAAEMFVRQQRHGYLIATGVDGFPSVSILPFVKRGDQIDLHCVRADPTFAAVQANPRATFFVSDFLAFSPHDWVDPQNAARGTLHFQAVQYACDATTSTDPEDVAAALRLLLESYEPEATYQPLVDGDFYGPRLRQLATVRLHVRATQAKFKVGPAGPLEEKLAVVRGLRERGLDGDARAAAIIEAAARGDHAEPMAPPSPIKHTNPAHG